MNLFKKAFLYYEGTFQLHPSKFLVFFSKKTCSGKISYISETEFSSPKLKKLLIFHKIELSYIFSKKSFLLYFRKSDFLKKLLIVEEETFRAHIIKKTHSEKLSYILRNRTF